jgi:hypothetical protein
MENQVRYNFRRSEENLDALEWFFVIINKDERELSRIKTNIYRMFSPIIYERRGSEGVLKDDTRYRLINFDSELRLDSLWKQGIFKRILKDNNLYLRKDIDGLVNYIEEYIR